MENQQKAAPPSSPGIDSAKTLASSLSQLQDRWQKAYTGEQSLETARQRESAAAVARLAAELGSRYAPSRVGLAKFQRYHASQEPVLRRLEALGQALPAIIESGRGIVLYGSVGTGKDHLMAGLLYQAAAIGVACRWIGGQDLYGQLRDRMGTGRAEDELLRGLASPAVLALSDPVPPAGDLSDWRLEFLYRLADRRYRALRGTWLTVNAASVEDAEARLGSQVWDRLQEAAELVPCFWPSFRERAKR